MRSSHGATHPPPDSKKAMRTFGCFSHTPPQITARQASIISIVCVTMCCAPPCREAVHADLRHAGRGALMEPDREIEILGRGPERLVHRVVDRLVAMVRVRPDEGSLEVELFAHEAH